jgi:hypothetical protein
MAAKSAAGGLMVVATGDRLFEANALHFTRTGLAAGHPYQLRPLKQTVLSVNFGSRGTGNQSCGAATLPEYQLQVGHKSYSYTLLPIPAAAALDTLNTAARQYRDAPSFAFGDYEISAAIHETTAAVTLTVVDNVQDLASATLLLAVYDAGGRLKSVDSASVAITGAGDYTADFVLSAPLSSGESAKAFAWKDDNSPVTESRLIP